jgi:hypothetical protein
MNIKLSITQGKLTPQDELSENYWLEEFEKIKKLENITRFSGNKYKTNSITHIEWIVTKQNFDNNPLFDGIVLKNHPISAVNAEIMIDKNFYKKEFLEENLKPILKACKKNKIQCVNIPLKEFSNIQNVVIRKEFIKNIKVLGKAYLDIIFCFEFECEPEDILELVRGVKNFRLTYDTATITSFKNNKQTHKMFISKLYKHIYNVRLRDKALRGKPSNNQFGSGDVDFSEIITNLLFIHKYKGNFIMSPMKCEKNMELATAAEELKFFVNLISRLEKRFVTDYNKQQEVVMV